MNLLVFQALVGRPLVREPGRFLVSLLGVAIGVGLALAIHLVHHSAIVRFDSGIRQLSGSAEWTVTGPESGIPEKWLERNAWLYGAARVAPAVEQRVPAGPVGLMLTILGIDLLADPAVRDWGGAVSEGDWLQRLSAPDSLILGRAAAIRLGVAAGGEIELLVGASVRRFRVLEVWEEGRGPLAGGGLYALMDIATAQWSLHRLGMVDRIDIRFRPQTDPRPALERLRRTLPPGTRLERPAQRSAGAAEVSRAYRVNMALLSFVALLAGGFIIGNTLGLSVVRRRSLISLMRGMGLTRRQVTSLIVLDGLLVGALGSALGLLLGWGLAALLVSQLGGDLGAGYFYGTAGRLALDLPGMALYFLVGIAVSGTASAWPAWQAGREDALVRRGVEERQVRHDRWRWAARGAILVMAGGFLTLLPPIYELPLFGYLSVLALLAGTLLMLPMLVAGVARPRAFSRWPVAQLAVTQVRAAPGRTAAAAAAIVVSLALMIAMGTMIASFRQSVDDWLHQILHADLYVRPEVGSGQWQGYLERDDIARLAALPGVRHVDPILWFRQADDARGSRKLLVRDLKWELTEGGIVLLAGSAGRNEIARVAAGEPMAYISEADAAIRDLKPGDTTWIDLPTGRVAVRILGVFRDYSNETGVVLMDRHLFTRIGGTAIADSAALFLAPGVSPARIRREIQSAFPEPYRLVIRSPALIRQRSLAIFDRTFLVTYALEAVAVIVGLMGVINTMTGQALARRAEFGVLRHLGMRVREVAAMLVVEAALVTGVGILAGLASAFSIAAVLIQVINYQSFHWSIEFHPPWAFLGASSLLVLLAGVAAAVAPARRLAGGDVLSAVRRE